MSKMSLLAAALAVAISSLGGSPSVLAAEAAGSEIRAGRDALLVENPRAALAHYRKALSLAGVDDREDGFAALMGMARAAAWLENYGLAQSSYGEAIGRAGSAEDRALATAGLAQMLNIDDRPHQALALAAPFAATSLPNAVEAARAALALGREDIAAGVLAPRRSDFSGSAESRLGREFREQEAEVAFRTRAVAFGIFQYARDSDGLRNYDAGIGTLFSAGSAPGQGPAPRWSVAAHRQRIDDSKSQTDITQVQGGVRVNLSEIVHLSTEWGAADNDDWTYAFGSAQLSYRPSDDWGLEAGIDRDAVKTLIGLANRLTVRSGSMGGDFRLGGTVVAGALAKQAFGDGNDRHSATVRVTFPGITLMENGPAVTLQLYGRYFEDSEPYTPGYFNPRRFSEQRLNFIFGTRLSPDWRLRAIVGPGRQSIDDTSSNTLTGELKLTGRLSGRARIDFAAIYGDTAAYATSGPGYRRTLVQATLFIPW